ncbi:MAG: sulfotransferase [Spongiibacteraceae bacterium]
MRKQTRPDTDPKRLGREWASLQELALQRGLAYRDCMQDSSQICDVHYNSLMRDPVGTVAGIYRHFGMEFTGAARAAVAMWLRDNPQDKHGVHKYTPEQFGLDANHIRERFSFYVDRFAVGRDG